MKRKIGIFALVFVIALSFFTVSAFAEGDNANSKIPFEESDEIFPEHPEIQTEEELMEEFEEMFGEGGEKILIVTIIGILVSLLFIPCLITVIVFAVLNSKTKKKIREYERFFGPIPENVPGYYNPNYNNNPYYGTQSVNPMNTPMGVPPSGNPYVPENDVNKWQGGQF